MIFRLQFVGVTSGIMTMGTQTLRSCSFTISPFRILLNPGIFWLQKTKFFKFSQLCFMLQSLKTSYNDLNYIIVSFAVISTSDGFFFPTSPGASVKKLNPFCAVKLPSKGASRGKKIALFLSSFNHLDPSNKPALSQ